MRTCEPQTVRGDVVRCFVAAATSSTDQNASGGPSAATERLLAFVVRVGSAATAPRAMPDGLQPTPNMLSVEEFLLRLRCSPLYVNMAFGLESMGGNGILKISASISVNVVISSRSLACR